MNARTWDEVRFVRPVAPGADRVRVTAQRIAVVAMVYASFAVAGALIVALACTLDSSRRFIVFGVAVAAIFFVVRKTRIGVRRSTWVAVAEITPVLLLYAHDKLQGKSLSALRKPHDYVQEAFKRFLENGMQTDRPPRAIVSALCVTIDALITSDAAKREQA